MGYVMVDLMVIDADVMVMYGDVITQLDMACGQFCGSGNAGQITPVHYRPQYSIELVRIEAI